MGPKHWHKKKIKGMAKESFYGIDQLSKMTMAYRLKQFGMRRLMMPDKLK